MLGLELARHERLRLGAVGELGIVEQVDHAGRAGHDRAGALAAGRFVALERGDGIISLLLIRRGKRSFSPAAQLVNSVWRARFGIVQIDELIEHRHQLGTIR